MIDLSRLWQLHALDRPELKDRAWPPITAGRLFVVALGAALLVLTLLVTQYFKTY